MRILVLEDDEFISDQIKTYFQLNEHHVDCFCDGEELLDNAMLEIYDIFLFDINTPRKNGLETLSYIRKEGITTPAIFLTALSDIEFVKKGYKIGCNDYVKKPFNLEEVELRIMQLVYKKNTEVILDKDYRFDIVNKELFFQDENIYLTKLNQELLYILTKNIGKIVSSEIITSYVWADKYICLNTLRTQIKKLRAIFKTNIILNIRNSGYKIQKYD